MHKITSGFARKIGTTLFRRSSSQFTHKNRYFFSEALFAENGSLSIRNSDTLEMKLLKLNPENKTMEQVGVQINSNATLQ